MRKTEISLFCILFSFFCTMPKAVSAQQDVDSLVDQFEDKRGLVNVDSLISRARYYFFNNPEKAYEIATRTIHIAESQEEPLKIGDSYRLMGNFHSDLKADYDSAKRYYQMADSVYRSIDSKEAAQGRGTVLHCYGAIAQRQGDYLGAIDYYTRALQIFDATAEMKTRLRTLNNISVLYAFLKEFEKTEKYARECISLSRQNKDEYMVSIGNLALADAMISQGKYGEVVARLDEAIEIAGKRNDLYVQCLGWLNYGNYYYLYTKDYPQAVGAFKKAREFAVQLGSEWDVMRSNVNLSEAYSLNNQPGEAYTSAEEAAEQSERMKAKDVQQRALSIMAKTDAQRGNFEAAYQKLQAACLLKDTVFDENNRRHLSYLESVYQTEKKELRINTLEKERKLYRIIFLVGTLGLFLFLTALYLRIRGIKAKKQLADQKIVQLEQENQLSAAQAVIDGETAERTRLARDLHDGLGGMLSAVKLNLFDMKQGVIIEAEDVTRFNKVVEILDSSMQELRRITHNMMPEALSRYGLKVALNEFCNSMRHVHFHFFGDDQRLDHILEVAIYRIVYELVNNALKHADARNIHVQLIIESDLVSVNVHDDGKGFNPDAETEGTGLHNIRTRVASLNGTLQIHSQPDEGTEIEVEFKK